MLHITTLRQVYFLFDKDTVDQAGIYLLSAGSKCAVITKGDMN